MPHAAYNRVMQKAKCKIDEEPVGDGAIDVPKSSLDKTYVYEYNDNGDVACVKT